MKTIIIGYGIQGKKRQKFLNDDLVCIVDPVDKQAHYKHVEQVPLNTYDSALICTPDEPKFSILEYLLSNNKNALVEKPLILTKERNKKLQDISIEAVCYTAYNHRFEPHFIKLKEILDSGVLGKIYKCRTFYGNGTALDVKKSVWRDTGNGVINDLGSHVIDSMLYWFGNSIKPFKIRYLNAFENKAPDHALLFSDGDIFIELEVSLLSWKNTFKCDVFGENGSVHIDSLCKWGPSTITTRTRIRPSGQPTEISEVLVKPDPTWEKEYAYFRHLCKTMNGWNNLEKDLWIQKSLQS